MKFITQYRKLLVASIVVIGLLAACKKDYYQDSGLAKGKFEGSVLDYLKSKPFYFDTLVQVIDLAGMNDIFSKEQITFFAPSNACFDSTLEHTNKLLYAAGKDTISQLSQVPSELWRKILTRYIFKGKSMLNDFPQLDPAYFGTYPGQFYKSYDGALMNIGVIYGDAGGAQYAGYRQLVLSYTPDVTFKPSSWRIALVSSVNIEPRNGAVHVLRFGPIGGYSSHDFGFDKYEFYQLCTQYGVGE